MKDFGFGGLRIPEIHHFIEKFVDYDKIVTDGFFFEFFKVLDHHLLSEKLPSGQNDLDDFVEEEDDFDGIGVSFCQGEKVQIAMPDIEVLRI